jgi:hypothetical protein
MKRKQIDIKDAGPEFERILASWLIYAWSRKPKGEGLQDMNNEFVERWKIVVPDAVLMAHRLAELKWDSLERDPDLFAAISEACNG